MVEKFNKSSDYVAKRALKFYYYDGGFVKANARTREIIVPLYVRYIKQEEGNSLTHSQFKEYFKMFIHDYDYHVSKALLMYAK